MKEYKIYCVKIERTAAGERHETEEYRKNLLAESERDAIEIYAKETGSDWFLHHEMYGDSYTRFYKAVKV